MKRIYGILTSAGLAGLLAALYFVTVNAAPVSGTATAAERR